MRQNQWWRRTWERALLKEFARGDAAGASCWGGGRVFSKVMCRIKQSIVSVEGRWREGGGSGGGGEEEETSEQKDDGRYFNFQFQN